LQIGSSGIDFSIVQLDTKVNLRLKKNRSCARIPVIL
jgi:hypothetical protein